MPTLSQRAKRTTFVALPFTLLLTLSACGGGMDEAPDGAFLANDATTQPTGPSPDATPDVEMDDTQPVNPASNNAADEQNTPGAEAPLLDALGVPVLNEFVNDPTLRLINTLEAAVTESLIEMNARLQSGEALTEAQSACLDTFDPALGEALLAINCGNEALAVSVPNFSLRLTSGAVAASSSCNDELLALEAGSCRLVSADLLLPVEWQVPESGLPRPYWSGFAEYNLEPDTLRLYSLENSVTGFYDCSVNLADATIMSAASFGDCNAHFDRFTLRLQAFLDRR